MKHNWRLEFQEREEKPNDYLRSVMVMNQSGELKKLPVVGLYILFQTGSKALDSSALSPPAFQWGVCEARGHRIGTAWRFPEGLAFDPGFRAGSGSCEPCLTSSALSALVPHQPPTFLG